MAHSSETKKWSCLNSKEDLIDNFIDCVDQEVIELVIETRNNNLLLAFRDLEEIAKTSNSNPDLHLLSTKEKTKIYDATGSDIFNIIDWERLSKNETPTNRVLYLVSRGYKVMVLMRGCPGCGKSYKAANILGQCYENAKVNDFIFSADNYFINKHTDRYCFNRDKLSAAHQWTMENVQKAVQNEITPIFIDNTNTLAWEMEPYVKLSVNNGYWIEIIEPNTEWAWNAEELAKKNSHNVSYSSIILMLKRYDHYINIENLLRRFKFKYSKNNQPPQLSKNFKKYQLCKNLTDANKVGIKPQIELNELKELHISQKQNNNKNQFKNSNNCKEDELCVKIIQEKEELYFDDKCENLFYDLSDDDNQSTSSTEEASNYVNKSVNTDENDFLFMEFLNEIPEEEYRDYVSIGTNRDINEGNQNILIMPCDKFDKGTTTHDLLENVYKLNLNELHAQFPENICSLISELFDECNGNIEWIIDMLNESGYDISKQQLYALIQLEENNTIENIPIQNIKENFSLNNVQYSQDNNTTIISENVLSKTITSNENGLIEKTDSKKKKHKKKKNLNDSKEQKSQITENNLRIDIENKFVFGDSLYSDHVLKIKKAKENKSIFDNDSIKLEGVNNDINAVQTNTEYVQLVMNTSVLTQLCDYFGDFSSDLNKNSFPMSVKLPKKLAEDLYYCLIANVPSDIFNQEAILQDEFMARKLQEESEKEHSSIIKNSCTGELTFAAVLTKKLLLEKFKNLDSKVVLNVLRDNNYKFQESTDFLSQLGGNKWSTNQITSNISENDDSHLNVIEHEPNNYEQEALEHGQLKRQFLNKANQSLSSSKHSAITAYYLDKAEEHKQNEKYAKTNALTDMVIKNKNAPILDLHNLSVTDALLVLDIYLDYHVTSLKEMKNRFSRGRHLTIITGRGKHSPNGVARIKPVVIRRLKDRKLMFFEPENVPGSIMVIIKKNSLHSLQCEQ